MNKDLRIVVMPLLFVVLQAVFLHACRTADPKLLAESLNQDSPSSREEQDKKAYTLFQEYFGLTSIAERKTVLGRIEAIFTEVIRDCPNATLAPQAYSHLVRIYLNDFSPPLYDKVDELYQLFRKKYPGSQVSGEIEEAIYRACLRDGNWEKVLRLSTPAVKKYIETRQLDQPRDLYYYSEAKLNLGNIVEAEKGFKIILSLFPKSAEGVKARERLVDLQKKNKND